ncbi:MAG: SusC/RagA family TonB-linked outer membrane protein [Sphingobacteriales bacterium]|nr:MAG: SusC/RagA family TonB-linked outer membrane protein [Sphingobacteriales bacterium]
MRSLNAKKTEMKMRSIFIFLLLLGSVRISAQETEKIIMGKVSMTKETERPPSITIMALLSRVSIAAKIGEEYQITLSSLPDTLLFIAVGYDTLRIPVNKNTGRVNPVMHASVQQLDEVIINTGYQKRKINEQNGSVAQISNETLNSQTGSNILARIDGVSSSLIFNKGKSNSNPQNSTNISIRGLSTINGPLDPLIVLDNFIYEGDVANINPNDVESVSILKDAAAASIWGARAGNGVIVINTKTARYNQPLQISFNANAVLSSKPDLFKIPSMSTSDYVEVESLLFNKGYFDSQINTSPFAALTPAVEILLKRRQGKISAMDSAAQINSLKLGNTTKSYSDHFYRSAMLQQYNLAFRGGGANNQYLFSASYDQNGSENYGQSDKLNFRFINTYKPLQNLSIQTGFFYTNAKSLSGRPTHNSIQINGRIPNYLGFTDGQGNPIAVATALSSNYTDTAGNGRLLNWKYYPAEDYLYNRSTARGQEVYLNTGISYQLFPFLGIEVKYQYQKQQQETQNLAEEESYWARNLINSFSQLNRSTGIVKYIVPMGGINTMGISTVRSQTLRGQINFEKSWNVHSLSAIGGIESREALTESSGNTLYGYRADPLTSGAVDFVGTYPNFVTGNSETISNNTNLNSINNRFVSFYANIVYRLDQRYTLTTSARRDGSNIFGAGTNDKWKPLWSVGLGWELSAEPFFRIKAISLLKLTATYGKSGNVDLSRSAIPIATYGNSTVTGLRFARISTISNPSLRWEESAQLNLRLDFSIRNQLLSGSIEYYRKKGTDLYGLSPYDYTTWGRSSTVTQNIAGMLGHGVDIMLQTKDFGEGFRYSFSVLHSYNVSKTTSYYGSSANQLTSLLSNGSRITPLIGKPLYAIAAYKWAGLSADGDPMGYLNGQASTDYMAMAAEANTKGTDGNIVYIGPASPVHFGSLIGNFKWLRFTATINLSYKLGYYFTKPAFSSQALIGGIEQADYADRWKKPGDELITDIPAFNYPNSSDRDAFYATSEINVIKGDHLRLRYINLSYRIFSSSKKRSVYSNLEIYGNIANLGILWRANKDKLDPDNPATLPPSRTISLGIRSNF